MAHRQPLNEEQRRLLRITARMPLASVANLAPVLGLDEERVRRMLGALQRGGWVASIVRGMTERRQHRWFLTRRAVDLLYVTDHSISLPGSRPGPKGWPSSTPRANCPRTTGSVSPWTTTIPPTWRAWAILPSPPVNRLIQTAAALTTSTRPRPPRRGASRPLCDGWPCWSRPTVWPRT